MNIKIEVDMSDLELDIDKVESAIEKELDILSTTMVVEKKLKRKTVGDTDIGKEIKGQIEELKFLLKAYREGAIF